MQVLTSNTPVHNINSTKHSGKEDRMQAMILQVVLWMQSVVWTKKTTQINIVLSVLLVFYPLLAIKLSIASLHFEGLKPIFETLCLYSYI